MIEYLAAKTPTSIVAKFSGALTGAEYKGFVDRVESVVKANGFANLVTVMEDLEFPEWDAIKMDARFGFTAYRNVRRAAFVGEQKWVEWFFKLIGPFTRAEERNFHLGELDQAVEWASS